MIGQRLKQFKIANFAEELINKDNVRRMERTAHIANGKDILQKFVIKRRGTFKILVANNKLVTNQKTRNKVSIVFSSITLMKKTKFQIRFLQD